MLRRGIQESYEDVRELLVHFRTRVEQQDLDAAIAAALRRLAEQTGIATDLDVQGDGAPLDPESETQVLYIIQEALSNVRKHAGATRFRWACGEVATGSRWRCATTAWALRKTVTRPTAGAYRPADHARARHADRWPLCGALVARAWHRDPTGTAANERGAGLMAEEKIRVLLVDDHAVPAASVRCCRATSASRWWARPATGARASAAGQLRPDVVLLDNNMPGSRA